MDRVLGVGDATEEFYLFMDALNWHNKHVLGKKIVKKLTFVRNTIMASRLFGYIKDYSFSSFGNK